MRLTSYTDYALRVLIYLAVLPKGQATISEIANFYSISRNHLVKIVHQLSGKGFIKTTRGKRGGLSLARAPVLIRVGDVVRNMENHFYWVECFNPNSQECKLLPDYRLKHLLMVAGNAYLGILDDANLADVIPNFQFTSKVKAD